MSARRCSEVQDELALARLEGVALSPTAQAHIHACSGCRLERVRLEEILGGLDADPVPDPPEVYWASFLPRLRTRLAAESLSAPHPFQARWWAIAATAASFFIAGIAVGGWRTPAELDATARLHRLAIDIDPEGLQQALDLIAPDREPFAGDDKNTAVPLAASMQDALEEVFPEDDPAIYESTGELSSEQQRRLAQSLDEGWV
jgi:hypothetical protein